MNMSLTVNIFLAYPDELENPEYGSFTKGIADVVHKLNDDQEFSNVKLVLRHWKISSSIGLSPDGPQGQIDSHLQDSDILVFAFGHTIGDGMLHEIDVALNRPQPLHKYISFFFPKELPQPKDSHEAKKAFIFHETREKLWKIGLIGQYKNIDHLISSVADNLRKHVQEFLKYRNAGGTAPFCYQANPLLRI